MPPASFPLAHLHHVLTTVNVIGAHSTKLNSTLFATGESWTAIALKGPESHASYKNGAKDVWVQMLLSAGATAPHSSQACKAGSMDVCTYAVGNNTAGRFSCGFILPAGEVLECAGTGGMTVAAAHARPFAQSVITPGAAASQTAAAACPPVTGATKSTMCDCSYTNPHESQDMIIGMSAGSADANFNSFHCAVYGVNVCAWGSNLNNQHDAGSCYFVLPAGATYACQMEWGSTSFTATVSVALAGSIYPPARTMPLGGAPGRAPGRVPGSQLLPSRASPDLDALFALWMSQHNRSYTSAKEMQARRNNFAIHVALADNMEARQGRTTTDSFNALADLSVAEFEELYRDCAHTAGALGPYTGPLPVASPAVVAALPTSVDWTTKGAVTPVKDQGRCGSCWSFSTTGALESHWFLADNPLVSLSEQNLVSCETDCDGCGGGFPRKAMDYVAAHGIATEASYPYASGGGTAPGCSSGHTMASVRVLNHTMLPQDEDSVAAYVAQHGPVSISVDAMTQLWWVYKGGIMDGCCNKEPDHAVLIVGYGEDSGKKYWKIKNSWATTWGESGYLRLARWVEWQTVLGPT